MRHQKTVDKLSHPTDQRMALLRNLVSTVLLEGFVDTTIQRAKSAQSLLERILTWAKRGSLADFRRIAKYVNGKNPFNAMRKDVIPNLPNVNSGFTKIVRVKMRRGDGAVVARLFIPTHPKFQGRFTEKE